MLELTMNATCGNKKPTILLDYVQDFADFRAESISKMLIIQYFPVFAA